MQSIRAKVSTLLRPVRFLVATCICALLVFATVSPAYAASHNPAKVGGGNPEQVKGSSPQQGEENLLSIEKKSQDAAVSKPYSLGKTEKVANEGLNEIQGAADANKMKSPENTEGATSIEDIVKAGLEKASGK